MFYTYRQNNSGGSFDINDEVSLYVIIEADSATEANDIAEIKGLYFDGCEEGFDCECCGDRWDSQYDDTDGTETPMIYNEAASEYKDTWAGDKPYCFVYYKNGTKLSLSVGAN